MLFYKWLLHFLSRERKRKQSRQGVTGFKRPCPASSCASTRRPEHAETRFAQTVRALYPAPTPMLGAGQRETGKPKDKNRF
jgi:hypothetical protein